MKYFVIFTIIGKLPLECERKMDHLGCFWDLQIGLNELSKQETRLSKQDASLSKQETRITKQVQAISQQAPKSRIWLVYHSISIIGTFMLT